jgi:hypothetical protein
MYLPSEEIRGFPKDSKIYSIPTIKLGIKNQELALRRFTPQRLILLGRE